VLDLFQKNSIAIDFNGVFLRGDVTLGGGDKPLLLLHGAGSSTRGQFDPLRQQLWENGIQSASFDFVGQVRQGDVYNLQACNIDLNKLVESLRQCN